MRNINIGDRVIAQPGFGSSYYLRGGEIGTVVIVDGARVGVDFDHPFGDGWDLDGNAKPRCGRLGHSQKLDLLSTPNTPEKYHIRGFTSLWS